MKSVNNDIVHNLVDRSTGKAVQMNDAAWKARIKAGAESAYTYISAENAKTKQVMHMGGMVVNDVLAYRPKSTCNTCGG